MVSQNDYKTRFAEAMKMSGTDEHALAKAVGTSYQAIKKVLLGTTKMMSAENNSVAASFMAVDSDWLATGKGQPRGAKVWPFTTELLAACRGADPAKLRQAENAARNVLDMDLLPRSESAAAA
jgi:hypothetical protein